jgi:RIP metalloprotease RseP
MRGAIVIVGLILMVVIHEGSHFLAAKAFRMKATEAFFGFGPRLWSMKRGETEYGIKALPLGGYVRIIGMNPFEEVAAEDEGRTYRENPFWKKSVVVLAGVASHFVVALVLLYVVIVGFGVPGLTTSIERVCPALVQALAVPDAQPFAFSNQRCLIIEVDGIPVETWLGEDKEPGVLTAVTVEVNGVKSTVETTDRLQPTPALLSVAQVGDRIAEFDGVNIATWRDFQDAAIAAPGKMVDVVVERGGVLIPFTTTLLSRTNSLGRAEGFFGVSPQSKVQPYSPLGGFAKAGAQTWAGVEASLDGLFSLVSNFGDLVGAAATGSDVPEEVRPISVVGLVGVANAGPVEFSLELLAFVNIFVGILNFVPMYPLDGGHFAVALYERVRGRPADVRKLMPVAVAVFIFIVVLGLLGFYFDFVDPLQLVARLAPW